MASIRHTSIFVHISSSLYRETILHPKDRQIDGTGQNKILTNLITHPIQNKLVIQQCLCTPTSYAQQSLTLRAETK
jgi:hypothetical protein